MKNDVINLCKMKCHSKYVFQLLFPRVSLHKFLCILNTHVVIIIFHNVVLLHLPIFLMLGCRQKNDEEIKKEVTEVKRTQNS